MLGIGFKLSDTPPASIERPLREYIAREYAPTAATEAPNAAALTPAQEEALTQFLQLKNDVDLVRTPSAISRHVLLRYYGQLERFAARFPCADTQAPGAAMASGSPPLKLQFTWNDSFCPRKKITQSSVKFEQAAVLFNYGALESQLGVQTDRSDAEGLKAVCKHFMLAAGAFTAVKDQLMSHCLGTRTPDMSVEGLNMLTQLMLAQAQACFYEKAIKDQMKDAIKAKLVHQALEFYLAALDCANSSTLNGTIDPTWARHVQFQVSCMRTATQFWQAKATKEVALQRGVGYGEEISRLIAADAESQKAIEQATQNRLPQSLIQSARALQNVVQENLRVAQKDNASIYLENVPRFNDLPAVGKACMVKPLVLTAAEIANEMPNGDLFEQFVPNAVRQQAAAIKDEVQQLVQKTVEKVGKSNEAVKQKLQVLGLPASIEAFEKTSDNGIPTTIWGKIQYLQTSNRMLLGDPAAASRVVQDHIQANAQASEQTEKRLHGIDKKLSDEEAEDNVCRLNYGGSKWSRPASSALNRSFRDDIDRYYRLLNEAKTSDNVVQDKLQTHQQLLELLSQSKASLDAQLPLLEQQNSSCTQEIEALSTLLLRLGHLMEEKEQIVNDFHASHEKFNALPVLLKGLDQAATDAALAQEKQFFVQHFVERVDAICTEELTVLGEITVANKQFEGKKANDPLLLARQTFLQQLSDAVDVFEQLQSHVKEGKKFYTDLTARVQELEQTVADHCAARDLEKRELELNLRADEEMRQREAHDARVAEQMMRDLHVRDTTAMQSQTQMSDEAFARQLAGDTPQLYPSQAAQATRSPSGQGPPPPSYDYAMAQAHATNSPPAGARPSYQPATQGTGAYGYGQSHVYTQYQNGSQANAPRNPYGYASAPQQSYSSSPPAPQYMNYYNQAPPNASGPTQSQTMPPSQYYQYPAYQNYQGQAQQPAPHPGFPRSPPGSSV
ncbi:TPA: hypothetical protein N0F65_009792 [Lagenidium giganteum]|uniref:BRO1 domain-containing protein n=1 Tax=Lagenidium giganteum TaxID=4803 RepID=A0AAV2YK21_9STRA|nr:TPA: hypothetical protein N0F65_009792 [Lagenidium giganteum]